MTYKVRAKDGTNYSDYCAEDDIVMLGSELINQTTWYTNAYWTAYRDTWTQSGTTFICIKEASAYAGRASVWTIGKTYKVKFTLTINGGSNPGLYIYDNVNLGTKYTTSGSFTFYKLVAGTGLWLSGAYCDLILSALSIKEVLFP